MLKSLDFSTAQHYDLNTSAYTSSATSYGNCEEKVVASGTPSTDPTYRAKVSECYAKQRQDSTTTQQKGRFGQFIQSLSCDSQCQKKGTKPEDMTACISECQSQRQTTAQNILQGLNLGGLFGGSKTPPPPTYDNTSRQSSGDTSGGISTTSIIIIVVVIIVLIVVMALLMKKKGKKE